MTLYAPKATLNLGYIIIPPSLFCKRLKGKKYIKGNFSEILPIWV